MGLDSLEAVVAQHGARIERLEEDRRRQNGALEDLGDAVAALRTEFERRFNKLLVLIASTLAGVVADLLLRLAAFGR